MNKRSKSKVSASFVDRPSPNFNDRKGEAVQFLVLHYTSMATAEAAIQRLCDPASGVSSHYVIDEQGVIYRLVGEDKRAWHAGVSYWDGKTDLNSTSVGIEIANPGDAPYPKAQMDSVIALSRDIVRRHKIRSFYVVGHSDIAPDRKQDPGEFFDWQLLAGQSLGVWPQPTAADYKNSAKWDDQALAKVLAKLGYRATIELPTLVTAFQRHFQPEVFKAPAPAGTKIGTADGETKARLACLLRRKNIADGRRRRS
jgi:N-acetylmuramoyl-L-alanine amidase